MTNEQAEAAVGATIARSGLSPMAGTVSETIARKSAGSEISGQLPQVSLGESAANGHSASGPDLVLIRELGSGGMGVVHLAEQRSLQREVAVKTARRSDEAVGKALVREGRLMGAVEHPNVVPIHSLGVDAAGAPLLVMKRVEGTSWRELLHDDQHPAWASLLLGHGDRLRANVDILVQVSRALSFAHVRGIVHRDLKPDNVMIGRFGEVYLLDWGIAIRLAEREAEPRGLVGTPSYMAPEMANADPLLVDARTDVYLLGATLYEVLTKRVPHEGATVVLALIAAVTGERAPIPASAPADLIALVGSAMSLERDARPLSAEAFREGLARYLASRETELVIEAARAAFSKAERKLAAEGAVSPDGYRALIEARFGLASAARARPADSSLRTQLDLTGVKLVERELALRSPAAARLLLAELAQRPPQLVRQVDELEQQIARERTAAEAVSKAKHEADASTTVKTFLFLWLANTCIWLFWAFWNSGIEGLRWTGGPLPVGQVASLDFGIGSAMALTLMVGRKALFATPGSTRLTLSMVILVFGLIVADLVNSVLGGDMNEGMAHWLVVGMCAGSVIALTEVPELWALVAVQAACLVAVLLWPLAAVWIGVTHHALGVSIVAWGVRRAAKRSRAV